jgi:hypothetical protein
MDSRSTLCTRLDKGAHSMSALFSLATKLTLGGLVGLIFPYPSSSTWSGDHVVQRELSDTNTSTR